MNHIVNHPDNTLPNDFQLTLDTHFVSCMLLSRKYGEPPVRVVRKSHPEEYGHQKYFDRLGYIYVYAKHVDEDKQNPKLLAEQRRRAFFETAARYLRDGKNLMICPEGTCTVTERSPLPLKAGAFRLATFVEPEPLIVPVVVANFDRKLTRTTLVAKRTRTVSSFRSRPEADSGRRALCVHCRLGGADALLGARRARAGLGGCFTLIELLVVLPCPLRCNRQTKMLPA